MSAATWQRRVAGRGAAERGAARAFLALDTDARAGLWREEVIALRLYTGPLFVLYNAVPRAFPQDIVEGNQHVVEGNEGGLRRRPSASAAASPSSPR